MKNLMHNSSCATTSISNGNFLLSHTIDSSNVTPAPETINKDIL